MLKRQNIKSKVASGGSCLLLLLLVFAFLNPIATSAYADEIDEEYGGNAADFDNSSVDGGLETYAATASTVNISFSSASANGAMTPVDSNGAKAKVDILATVRVQNSGGYKVYIGSNSSQLKNGDNTIDSVATPTTYANLPLNRWGYSFQEGATAKDNYEAMPATLRSIALDTNSSTNIKDEIKTYTLSFAANIGNDKPAGTYSNQVTMSVVSSPLEITSLTSLTNMQDMTNAICSSSTIGDSKQLKDMRDGKFYWVSKLADGKCWMTQNLDLDIKTASGALNTSNATPPEGVWPDASLSDYDETPSIKAHATSTTVASNTIDNTATSTYSWSLGNYRITKPDASSDCGYPKNSAANCTAQFTAYTTPTSANGDVNAHYILGNHYQWNVATAGTGGSIISGQATSSICPKGWRLPTSGAGGEFEQLVATLGGVSTTDNITKAPFYGVRGGVAYQSTTNLFYFAGDRGYYWSSTPYSTATSAYRLYFASTNSVEPSEYNARQRGYSIRCIAR